MVRCAEDSSVNRSNKAFCKQNLGVGVGQNVVHLGCLKERADGRVVKAASLRRPRYDHKAWIIIKEDGDTIALV